MKRAEIEAQVKSFLREECHLDTDNIAGDDPLFSTYLLASIDFIDLLAFIEKHFGVVLDAVDANFDNLDTVSRIVEFVHSRRAAA